MTTKGKFRLIGLWIFILLLSPILPLVCAIVWVTEGDSPIDMYLDTRKDIY